MLTGGALYKTMTEKIVQLTDDANNNIYPVAGSLKQGSVTTSTINDGAVTAAKIDYSTLQGGNVPIAFGSMHVPYVDGSEYIDIWRIGNVVWAHINLVISSMSAYDSASAAEVMPSGFRPATNTKGIIILNAVAGGGNSTMGVIVNPDGTTTFSNRATINLSTRFYGYGCWVTKDAWPS